MARAVSITLSCALSSILCLAQQLPSAPKPARPLQARDQVVSPGKLAGDAACAGCHQKYSSQYPQTSHHLTSRLAGTAAILGSFSESGNTLRTLDPTPGSSLPGLSFLMQKKDGG